MKICTQTCIHIFKNACIYTKELIKCIPGKFISLCTSSRVLQQVFKIGNTPWSGVANSLGIYCILLAQMFLMMMNFTAHNWKKKLFSFPLTVFVPPTQSMPRVQMMELFVFGTSYVVTKKRSSEVGWKPQLLPPVECGIIVSTVFPCQDLFTCGWGITHIYLGTVGLAHFDIQV